METLTQQPWYRGHWGNPVNVWTFDPLATRKWITDNQLADRFGKLVVIPPRVPVKITFYGSVDKFTLFNVMGDHLQPQSVKPAIRGPLMVRVDGVTQSIYDIAWRSFHGTEVPIGQRAVPINRDYQSIPTSDTLVLVPIETLDQEYRDNRADGRASSFDLPTLLHISRMLKGKTIGTVAKDVKKAHTTIAQISSGLTYWYVI